MFGQSSTANTFGQPTAFGATTATPFGTMNATQPQQSSLFGQTPSSGLFGLSQPNSIFNSTNTNQANTFGTPQQSNFGGTSLFGASTQPQNNSLFGNANNRFGMTTGTTFSGTLGQPLNVPTGTTVKFVPQTGTDTMMKNGNSHSTSINIRLQCITCMREYESKSLEELRLEDYNANRKGPQQSNLFGTTNISSGGSLFNTTNTANTFGATASSGNLFNQNKNTFGSIAPTTTTTSIFGSNFNANKPNFFSNPANPTTGFPNQTQPTLFGQTSTQPLGTTSFFGSNNLNTNTSIDPLKPMFGQTAPQSTPFFGANATQNLNTANKPVFGSATFGAQPQTSNTLFGSTPANSGNVFGATSQPSFFNTNTSTNAAIGNKPLFNFSSSAPSFNTTGLGTTTSTSNLFGAPNTFGTTGGSNLFGSTLNSGFNFNSASQPFQNSASTLQLNSGGFGGNNNAFGANNLNQAQPNLANATSPANNDQILARLQTLPYGFPQLPIYNSSFNSVKTKFTTDPKTLNQYKINAKLQVDVKVPRVATSGKPTTLLFDGLDDESAENSKCAQDIFSPRPNIKKLVLNKSNASPFKSSFVKSPAQNQAEISVNSNEDRSHDASISPKQPLETTIDVINKLHNEAKEANTSPYKASYSNSLHLSTEEQHNASNNFVPKCGIVLSRTDYYTIPSIEECDTFYNADNDSCIVDSFTVGRVDYGSIYWGGPLNIKGLNLDDIIHIRRKEVIVYPDDDAKPPIGEGLNRAAQITLDQVWPIDKTTREFIKDPQRLRAMKYSEKVEAATNKLDATFKDYRPDTGSWVFAVKHFSKYGLDADDEDIDMDDKNVRDKKEMHNVQEKKDLLKANAESVKQFSMNVPVELPPKDVSCHINGDLNSNMAISFHADDTMPNSTMMQNIPFSNLFQSDNVDSLSAEDGGVDGRLCNEKSAMNQLNLMRSTLFLDQEEEVENVTKKCKNLSFTKSATSQQIFPSLFPCKIKPIVTKRRKLQFESSDWKYKSNIYSVATSPSPRVNFSNGSNKFCLILGGQVLIFAVDLLELEKNAGTEKLENHLSNFSVIEPSSDSLYPPIIKSTKFELSVGAEANLSSLIEALYGELSESLNYSRYQERLHRIETWLFNYNKTLPVPEKSYARIMHFLTTNELEFAATECINSKQPRLSYLISSGPFVNKLTILSQLHHWKRSDSDTFIDHELLKLYILLSGQSKWTLSNGDCINVFEGLHWTQQLVLGLLYKNRQTDDSQIFGTNLVKMAIAEIEEVPNVVEYHLLTQNEAWVAIASCTKLLDSWFLHESLASFNVIVHDNLVNKSDSINLYLASQCADIRWALFFVLHIRNDLLRYHSTANLLVRNSTQLIQPQVEDFLKKKLSIDHRMISEAKVYYCRSRFDYKATAFNLIECDRFSEAHDILTDQVFPELVINEDYTEILHLIDRLRSHQHLLPNWNICGAGIYEIFIELLNFNSGKDVNRYKHMIEHFNVHQLRCPTKRHYLCQSQMARIANIIHAELNNGMFAYNTSVPDDYALLELRSNVYKILETDYCTS